MRQAQRREAELEGVNAELTESMAAKQREADQLKAALALQGAGGGSQAADLEIHRWVGAGDRGKGNACVLFVVCWLRVV
jgi:hypothetical protein